MCIWKLLFKWLSFYQGFSTRTAKRIPFFSFCIAVTEERMVKCFEPSFKIFILHQKKKSGLGFKKGLGGLNAWICWTQWETPGSTFLHREVTLQTKRHTTCWLLYWETENYVTRNHKQSACEMRRHTRDKFNQVYGHFEICSHKASTGEEIFSYKTAVCQVKP